MELNLEMMRQMAYALGVGLLIGLERSLGVVLSDKSKDGARGARDGEAKPGALPPELPSDGTAEQDRPAAAEPVWEDGETEAPQADPTKLSSETDVGELLGLRTFAILSMLGYTTALATEKFPFVAPIGLLAGAAIVVAMYYRASQHGTGITTEVAAISCVALGVLCRYHPDAAGVLALIITVLLSLKTFSYGVLRKMRRVELTDTLKFLVVILIVLPMLPNRALDPYNAFNPYKVGVLVVLISGISFVGYFLTRILGAQKGLGITGLVGGLTSSTAVTAAMAQQAKERPHLSAICAFSTIIANATMFVRVLVVVAVLNIPLVKRLAWSLGGMALAALICTVVLWFSAAKGEPAKGGKQPKAASKKMPSPPSAAAEGAAADEEAQQKEVDLKNPFSLGPALKFAAFFVFILFLLKLAKIFLGNQGTLVAAAVSGLADVDAITLATAEEVKNASPAGYLEALNVGTIAITIAVVANSATKSGIAIYSGGWRFGRIVLTCLGIATVVGLTAAVVVPRFLPEEIPAPPAAAAQPGAPSAAQAASAQASSSASAAAGPEADAAPAASTALASSASAAAGPEGAAAPKAPPSAVPDGGLGRVPPSAAVTW